MARVNLVTLAGEVVSEEFDPRFIKAELTDGENGQTVLNFLVRCYDETAKRFYKLPVAVWGTELSSQCMKHMKKGSLIYAEGELRYKHIYDHNENKTKKIYTTVKASTVEFISKKLKEEKLDYYLNQVKLVGNLVHDPVKTDEGFVIAVDRLYPTKEVKAPNSKLTDFVTLVVDEKSVMKGNLKKGSVAIVEGSLMTKKKIEDVVIPRIVVKVEKMVGR